MDDFLLKNDSFSNYSGTVRLQKVIKGPYWTQMGITNSFRLIEPTMRLPTLALLIILPATAYAAAHPQLNSLESRRGRRCANILETCLGHNLLLPCCDRNMHCGDFVDAVTGQVSVRYRVPVHLFCFLLTGILVSQCVHLRLKTSRRSWSA